MCHVVSRNVLGKPGNGVNTLNSVQYLDNGKSILDEMQNNRAIKTNFIGCSNRGSQKSECDFLCQHETSQTIQTITLKMADKWWSDIYKLKILCGRMFVLGKLQS